MVRSAVGVLSMIRLVLASAIVGFTPSAVAQMPAAAQTPTTCSRAVAWSACDVVFDLSTLENTPQATLRAEFRSPHHKTILINAFHEGSRVILRFAPTEAGAWTYRLTSSVTRLDGQTGQLSAGESSSPGLVQVTNVHHFATQPVPDGNLKPHLWMGAPVNHFVTMPRADFDRLIELRAKDRFTHVQVTVDLNTNDGNTNLDEAAERIRALNAKGMVADVALAMVPSEAGERTRYVADVVARFSAFNITWAGIPNFENVPNGRAILKEMGAAIQKLDPYGHPRWTLAASTAGPAASDGWANLLGYGTASVDIGAVEHQFYAMPGLNAGIQSRADLWNATMNGQYPESGDGPYSKVWFDFLSASRYWELEPYFDVEGGRAIALEGVEYLVYVEKPGTVTLKVENHGYDVVWMNPANGELVKQKKDYKGEMFIGEPPDSSHDWVLRVSREGHKEGMLKSYKFESSAVVPQVVEVAPAKIPFEISAPAGDEISISQPAKFALKVKRDTKATKSLLVEWTLEQPGGAAAYRVVGTGTEGTFSIPRQVVEKMQGVVTLRANVVNTFGKAYTLDKVYRLIS